MGARRSPWNVAGSGLVAAFTMVNASCGGAGLRHQGDPVRHAAPSASDSSAVSDASSPGRVAGGFASGLSDTDLVDGLDEGWTTGEADGASVDQVTDAVAESAHDSGARALEPGEAGETADESPGESVHTKDKVASRSPPGPAAAPNGVSRGTLSCELSSFVGYRSDTSMRFGGWRGVSGGFRASGAWLTGFVRVERDRWLESVHAGRLSLQAGERLFLGRGLGRYASSGRGSVREGLAVTPSFSRWFGQTGAAAALRWKEWALQAVLVITDRSENDRGSASRALWGSLARRTEGVAAGVTVGAPLENRATAPPASPAAARPILIWHGSIRGGGFNGSLELAQHGRGTFFAARLEERGWSRGFRWAAVVFRAPHVGSSGTSFEPNAKFDQGARLDVSSTRGTPGVKCSLTVGRTGSPSSEGAYRRLLVSLAGRRRGSVGWEVSALFKRDARVDYPSGPLVREPSTDAPAETRFRAAIDVRDGAAWLTGARIDYIAGNGGGTGSGVLLALFTERRVGGFEARIYASGYALGDRCRAYGSRPGVGPFEWFAPATDRGSDCSVRVRVPLGWGARAVLYYGSPGVGNTRVYIGVECRR